MSSGFYSALSGNLAKMQALETITNNLSNAATYGYKKDRIGFESHLSAARQIYEGKGLNFTRIRQSFIDYTPGPNQKTDGAFDFAIDGEGFFKVRGDEGGIFYTRAGQFKVDADGNLITDSNLQVLGEKDKPIILPGPEVDVDEQGRISDGGGEIGRIMLYTFDDPDLLQKRGSGLFVSPPGLENQVAERPRILRGYLETSNVNMMQEMTLMMEALRTFETYQKLIKTYGTIGSKADEIGSL